MDSDHQGEPLGVLILMPEPSRIRNLSRCLADDPAFQPLAIAATLEGGLQDMEAERLPPDVIVIDGTMPLADDTAFWALLRLRLGPWVPVVALTDPEDGERLENLFALGVFALMPPDAPPEDLCRALRRAAARKKTLHPAIEKKLQLHLGLPPEETWRLWGEPPRWDETTGELYLRGRRLPLTPREQQVLRLIGRGMTNREIARQLGIRPRTVAFHVTNLLEKTEVASRVGLIRLVSFIQGWPRDL